jgi:hypothetical protein
VGESVNLPAPIGDALAAAEALERSLKMLDGGMLDRIATIVNDVKEMLPDAIKLSDNVLKIMGKE